MHEALRTLSADCREILDRFFCRDQSYNTIGELLDLPPGTIASRISRCLGKLRQAYEGRSEPGSCVWRDMSENPMDEVRLAELLGELPPVPEAWLQAAQERPAIARAADQVLELAEADAEFRRTLIADLESALRAAGPRARPAARRHASPAPARRLIAPGR